MPEQAPSKPVDTMTPQAALSSEADLALMQKVFGAAVSRPDLIPEAFMSYVQDFIQVSRLLIPVGQLTGFTQYTANAATQISTQESRSATAYGDLATAGPELTGLGAGMYVVFFGATIRVSNDANTAYAALSVNGAAASDTDSISLNVAGSGASGQASLSRVIVKTLSDASNSLAIKYRSSVSGDSSEFSNRWLIALKYSNP